MFFFYERRSLIPRNFLRQEFDWNIGGKGVSSHLWQAIGKIYVTALQYSPVEDQASVTTTVTIKNDRTKVSKNLRQGSGNYVYFLDIYDNHPGKEIFSWHRIVPLYSSLHTKPPPDWLLIL